MQVLEKILQEIEVLGNIKFSSYTKPLIAVEDVVKIIRSHMEDDGWIPVEERLPDEHMEVLVSFEDGFNGVVAWYSYVNKSWRNANTERPIDAKIIAWQPLPAPYQPKED